MEETVSFFSDGLKIEGRFDPGDDNRGVVITHPHPLYGGDMDNPIVETLAAAYRKKGYGVLRFNFRGVGMSEGNFDNGVGEGQDLIAAVGFLKEKGRETIDLAGYSFGTDVIARVVSNDRDRSTDVDRIIMVSPPLGGSDADADQVAEKLTLVVTGRHDQIAPPDRLEQWLSRNRSGATLSVIENTDHFYGGGLSQLADILNRHL